MNKNMNIRSLYSFHMEASRTANGMSILLSGIIGVSDFSDTSILLLSHGGKICIRGSGLFISLYENNCLEIEGGVEDVSFAYGKA